MICACGLRRYGCLVSYGSPRTENGPEMPVHNADIANIFKRMAELLEMEDTNPFRVRAYRNAARTIEGRSHSVAEMVEAGESLADLPGIGKDLAGKIREIVETGRLSQLENLKQESPAGLHEVLRIPGLGPKRVKALYQKLHISGPEDLKSAAGEVGVKIAISTDAPSIDGLDNMRFGVDQARRGWLEKENVINTRTWGELRKLLKRK